MPKTTKYNHNYITIYFPDSSVIELFRSIAGRAKTQVTTYMRDVLAQHVKKIEQELRAKIQENLAIIARHRGVGLPGGDHQDL